MVLPWAVVARRRVHRAARLQPGRERQHQRRRFRLGVPAGEPGSDARRPARSRARRRSRPIRCAPSAAIQLDHARPAVALADQPRDPDLVQPARFATASRSASTTPGFVETRQHRRRALQHNPDGTFSDRADQAQADELLGNHAPLKHNFKGNFVWDLPDIHGSSGTRAAVGYIVNDWQLSGRVDRPRRAPRTSLARRIRTAAATRT